MGSEKDVSESSCDSVHGEEGFWQIVGSAIAGKVSVLFLSVLICRVPECVANDVEDVAVLVKMRLVRGRISGVALVMCVGLVPEWRM